LQHIPQPVNYMLFDILLNEYASRLVALGKAANNVAIRYAAEHSDFINPFQYSLVPEDATTPPDDVEFAKHVPSKIPRCGNDSDLPEYIDTPGGITRLMGQEFRLAERLDPQGHHIDYCYELRFGHNRVAQPRLPGSHHFET